VAKRVRTETQIGNSAVSVSSVAVDLAKKIFETLEEKTVLLVGAGEMSELAAQHLIAGGVRKVLVSNRTYDRAAGLAHQFKGEAIPFEEMSMGLRRADIVISATDSPQYLIRHEQVAKVMKDRKQKPIFFIDIADPRDIEPKEANKAESIVQDEVVKFVNWYRSLDITPTIVALRKKFEDIRKKELEKTFTIHPNLSEKERKSLEALTSSIINKVLHDPVTFMKRADEEMMTDLYIDTLRTLFQLPSNEVEGASGKDEEKPEDEEKEERMTSNGLA
jgi:glutamyl-tRNA reductase